MSNFKVQYLLFVPAMFLCLAMPAASQAQETLKIGVAGGEPFIVSAEAQTGIALEIWKDVATMSDINYELIPYENIPKALKELKKGTVDAVVGSIAITPERARELDFTQPYYQSSISIMSRTVTPSLWQRIEFLFNPKFLYAILGFLFILAVVGTLFWLAERRENKEEFSQTAIRGIGDGMWCAIVTMTTTGYGDISPRSLAGRIIAGSWMIFCIVFATTMVAGIASSLTLVAGNMQTITTADQLHGKKVAVVKDSPSEEFVKQYGGEAVYFPTLKKAYNGLKAEKVAAVVYDRPQMLYFLDHHQDESVTISTKRYMRQGYGFAIPEKENRLERIDIQLLKLQKNGTVNRIVTNWLGKND